jgi:formate hydrogenlyase subunit 3/multisubunit Na+/H+ antiporter MnhD subunit
LVASGILVWILHFSLGFVLFFYFYVVKLLLVKVYNLKRDFNIKNNLVFITNYLSVNLTAFLAYQSLLLITLKYSAHSATLNILVLFIFLFFLFFSWVFVYFMKRNINYQSETEVVFFIIMLLCLSLECLFFVSDFILFFLNLEIMSIIFYLFFLTYARNNNVSLIKYKNLLSNYVWGTFFSTILYFFAILVLVKSNGSLTFLQASFTYLFIPKYIWHIILVSFLIKVGGPGFYFFKLEIYQWLSTVGVYSFSIFTIFFNFFFFL